MMNTPPDYKSIDKSRDYSNSGGYIKVIYYFYQAVLLLRLSSYISSSSFPNSVISLLSPLLNFQFTNIWNCAGENLRPATKVFVKNSVAYWVLGFTFLVYLGFACVKKRRGITIDEAPAFKARSPPARLLGTCIHVILLSYVAQTQFAVQLLHCVKVGDQNVLYIDGSVSCYKSYQRFVWVYFLLYIVCFPFSLYVGRRLLASRKISWKQFILACFFPSVFLCIWAYKRFRHNNWPKLPDAYDPFREKIAYILQYPYKSPEYRNNPIFIEKCRENWEAVLMFRRLVLVIAFIFAKSFLLRAILFFILSMLFLLAHIFVQPFHDENVNKLDTISLMVIVGISGLSIAEASYNNAGQLLTDDVETSQIIQDWLLALIPFVLVAIFFYPRAKFCLNRCCKKRSGCQAVPTDDPSDEVVTNPAIANTRIANEASPLNA